MQTPPFLLDSLYNPGQYLLSPCIGSFKECLPDKQDVIERSSSSHPLLLPHQPLHSDQPLLLSSCLSSTIPFLLAHYLRAEVMKVDGQPRVPAEEVLQVVSIGREEVGLGVGGGSDF